MKKSQISESSLSLVNEIINFTKPGILIFGTSAENPFRVSLSNFEEAWYLSSEKLYTKDQYTWFDLVSEEESKIRKIIFDMKDYSLVENELESYCKKIYPPIYSLLGSKYDELIDSILSDLCNCIKSRALQGTQNVFFEKIFEAYKTGGWPCGWDGEWPEGEPIVLYPPSNGS